MAEFSTTRTSSPPDTPETSTPKRAKISNGAWAPCDEPWKMCEVMPHVFMSSWPPEIPDNITHTVNVCHRLPVLRVKHGGMKNHWTLPIHPDNDIAQSLTQIIQVVRDAVPSKSSPTPETNILIYSQHGINRAAIAVLAHMCSTLEISVVDAFFLLKEKNHDITPSNELMEKVQNAVRGGDGYDGSVGKEILRRITKDNGFKEVMKKARSEGWMYEAEE